MNKNFFSLKDKNIIITGAAGLLGHKHAEIITAFGAKPILIDKNLLKLKILKKYLIDKFNIKPIIMKIDITDEKEVKKSNLLLNKRINHLDGLVNNAANNPAMLKNRAKMNRLENFSLNNWSEDIAVSLTGSFLCSKYFGYQISKNKKGGCIVNISSDLGLIAPNQNLYKNKNKKTKDQEVKPVSYSVSKHGIIGLTKYLSTYWPKKVRCNAICPGGVYNNQDKPFINKISKLIPMERLARADEFQGILVYLLSDASTYLNGAIIPVDGGRSAW